MVTVTVTDTDMVTGMDTVTEAMKEVIISKMSTSPVSKACGAYSPESGSYSAAADVNRN
jgi:hypothetical protein